MSVQTQQETLMSVLPILRLFADDILISGGCPRDWYFGKECTDVDVWVNVGHLSQSALTQRIEFLSYTLGVDINSKDLNDYRGTDSSSYIYSLYTFEIEGLKFDLVCTNDITSRIPPNFCSNISMISLDLDNIIPLPSSDFMRAVNSKSITYKKYVTEDSKYYKKMKEKFPEFTHQLSKQTRKSKGTTATAYIGIDEIQRIQNEWRVR